MSNAKDVFVNPNLIFQHFHYSNKKDDDTSVTTAVQRKEEEDVFAPLRRRNREAYKRYQERMREAKKMRQREQHHRPSNKYRAYQYSAKRRKLTFTLTYAECYRMFTAPCHYCHHRAPDRLTNGIDRVRNAEGYTSTNTVPCCSDCNYMKHTFDYEVFLAQCDAIANRHNTATAEHVFK